MKNILLMQIFLSSILCFSQENSKQDTIKYNFLLNKSQVTNIAGKSIEYYLNSSQIDKYSKMYYKLQFVPSDDNTTLGFLDSILTKNNNTRPFYIFIFNQIAKVADGGLGEGMSYICLNFVTKFPCDFVQYSDNEELIKVDLWYSLLIYTQYNEKNIKKIDDVQYSIEKNCLGLKNKWEKMRKNIVKAEY